MMETITTLITPEDLRRSIQSRVRDEVSKEGFEFKTLTKIVMTEAEAVQVRYDWKHKPTIDTKPSAKDNRRPAARRERSRSYERRRRSEERGKKRRWEDTQDRSSR